MNKLIFLQPDGVNLCYFKLRLKVYDFGLKNRSLWPKTPLHNKIGTN